MKRFTASEIMSLTQQTARSDLAESVAPYLRLGELLELPDTEQLGDLELGYGTAAGNPGLRSLLAEHHRTEADDVVITTGGMHALFLIAFITLEPGDEVITTSALFPLARNTLNSVRANVQTLDVSFDNGFQLDLDELERLLSARTKLVSFATPQNPSGVAIEPATINAVVDLMNQVCPEAYLLIDETYREAAYGQAPPADSAVNLAPNIVVCASLSKCHGAPGLRIGWAITRNNPLRDQLLHGKYTTAISCSTLDEELAQRILANHHILTVRRDHLAQGLAKTQQWADRHNHLVDWIRPDGGALSCARLKPNVFDDNAVNTFYTALERNNCRVANGSWFGEPDRVFRLGFGYLALPELDGALGALSDALNASVPAKSSTGF